MHLLSYAECRKSKLEIYIDILRVAARGTCKPTMMLYTVNISRALLSKMLENLEGWGLLEQKKTKGHSMFLITEKGKRVLNKLDTLPMKTENYEQEKRCHMALSTSSNAIEI
ncbi:MAG: winged helix-turn-helix domain-containing protein [Candidatus Bathyarchaeota archaeon]|nr:winged helix-turn-helix domain-containing protein [Candidatus Bathyarchaeota archaeon]MCX8177648.1 winged helix-turn-helix domain-containing protein [Candidatus Bathyarchaeota archaeon]MDW8193904.1 winged helix-turn-helix domain-containing protein [Nitrososphaerota archaeon]